MGFEVSLKDGLARKAEEIRTQLSLQQVDRLPLLANSTMIFLSITMTTLVAR